MRLKKISIFLAFFLWTASACGQSTADIGIIGGADGPTKIIVGSTVKDENTFEQMPAEVLFSMDEIPVPPGTFASAWRNSDSDTLYITTDSADSDDFIIYVTQTLPDAGFDVSWNKSDTDEDNGMEALYYRNENERYSIHTTYINCVLMLEISPK